jgi:hypothetical protein
LESYRYLKAVVGGIVLAVALNPQQVGHHATQVNGVRDLHPLAQPPFHLLDRHPPVEPLAGDTRVRRQLHVSDDNPAASRGI